jgi:broad specificity phosphatase PhoE
MLKIMIIRHAEKHQHGSHDRGITEDGRPSHHELTVSGWQRAGALVHLFAPPGGLPDGCRIHTPRSIFASDATRDSPSLRAMHTAGPLAAALGIPVNHAYAEEVRGGAGGGSGRGAITGADRLAPWRHSAAGHGNRRQAARLSRPLAR